MACLCVSTGASRVVETVFENRFMHVQGLRRLVYDSEDYLEGLRAFLGKRKPSWYRE